MSRPLYIADFWLEAGGMTICLKCIHVTLPATVIALDVRRVMRVLPGRYSC